MEPLWADVLVAGGLLSHIALGALRVGGRMLEALALRGDKALEKLDDRHHGLDLAGALRLTLAIRKTRSLLPEARLQGALYAEELGVLLPEDFTGGSRAEDGALLSRVLHEGPFCLGPFLEDTVTALTAMV